MSTTIVRTSRPPLTEAHMSETIPQSGASPSSATEPASLKGTCADTMGLVVAPTTGRFEPATAVGRVRAGELLGHITGGRGRADEVRAPVDAFLKNLLVRPRQLVRQGQALAWLDVSPA
jgi:multidrug efflux pump subunit AcrA (membrane-fusion protein)